MRNHFPSSFLGCGNVLLFQDRRIFFIHFHNKNTYSSLKASSLSLKLFMYKHIQANFQPHINPHQQYQLSTAGVIHCRVEIVTKSLQAAVAVVILKYFNSHLFGIQVMSQTHFLADEIDDPRVSHLGIKSPL